MSLQSMSKKVSRSQETQWVLLQETIFMSMALQVTSDFCGPGTVHLLFMLREWPEEKDKWVEEHRGGVTVRVTDHSTCGILPLVILGTPWAVLG